MDGQSHPVSAILDSGGGELDITAAFTGFYDHLDLLDKSQADTIKLFHDAYQKQRTEIENLRKAVRVAETALLRNDYQRRMRQLHAAKPAAAEEKEASPSPCLAITEEPTDEREGLSGQAIANPVVPTKESNRDFSASSPLPLSPQVAVARRSSSPATVEEISFSTEEVPAFLERVSHSDTQSKDRPVQKMRPSRGRLSARRGGAAMAGRSKRTPATKPKTVVSLRSNSGKTPSPPILLDDESVGGFSTSKFVAINHATTRPTRSEPTLSSLPAGISGTPTSKPLPPAASQNRTSSRLLATNIPISPTLFSTRALKVLLGAGNPTKTVAKVTTDLLGCDSYICFSQDLHFNPPATAGADAELVDIYGKETPLPTTIYPVFKKVNRSFMYCGDYQVGSCKIIPHRVWQNSNESVRRTWATKIQETRWGRELLQEKEFLAAGEVRNITVQEVLGYFDIPDDSRGLRLSATKLHFRSFNSEAYDKLVEGSAAFSPQNTPPASAPQKRRRISNSGRDVVHSSPRVRGVGRKITRRATEGALYPVTITRASGRRKRDLESEVEEDPASQESD